MKNTQNVKVSRYPLIYVSTDDHKFKSFINDNRVLHDMNFKLFDKIVIFL